MSDLPEDGSLEASEGEVAEGVEDASDAEALEVSSDAQEEEEVSDGESDDFEDSSDDSLDEESDESDESDGESSEASSGSAPSRKKGAHVCGSCGKDIAGNVKDPVTHTSYGRLHYKCLQAVSTGKAPRVARSKPRLSDASIQNVAKAVKAAPKTPPKAEPAPKSVKAEKAEKAALVSSKKLSHKAKLEEMKRKFEKMQALAGDAPEDDEDL